MTVEDVLQILEREVAPVKLSDDFCAKYKMYDNSGVIVNCGNAVNGVTFSLDLSLSTVAEAVKNGCNLIVTHHPAIYGGVYRLDLTSNPLSKALAECVKLGISVISMHLNFDAAPNGIDYYLMRGIGGETCNVLAPCAGGGYGRAYNIPAVDFEGFVNNIKNEFSTRRVIVYGENKKIAKVASFCGQGCDENAIAFAKEQRVEAFVSSDLKHHQITELVDSGINVVQLTHYCAETYGFKQIYLNVKEKIKLPAYFYTDGRFM